MKRNLLPLGTAGVPLFAVALVITLALLSPAPLSAAADSRSKIVGVDYVLALLDAGIDQKEIVKRIEERNLSFHLAPGDVDRLREAGAGRNLVEVVAGEGNSYDVPAQPGQGGPGTDQWGRPNRLGTETPVNPQDSGEESYAPPASGDDSNNGDEGIEESPYGGGGYGGYGDGYGSYPSYDYYWPGYYGFVYTYGYPYYYYPYYSSYYYPYRSYYYGAHYPYPRHYYRSAPRGGGWGSSAPRGGGMHSAPHSGGGHSSPRGSGGGHSSPRGSHH